MRSHSLSRFSAMLLLLLGACGAQPDPAANAPPNPAAEELDSLDQGLDVLASGTAGWVVVSGTPTVSVNASGHLVFDGPGVFAKTLSGANRVNLTAEPTLSVSVAQANALFNLFCHVSGAGASFMRGNAASHRDAVVAAPGAGLRDVVFTLHLVSGGHYVFDRMQFMADASSAQMPAAPVLKSGNMRLDIPLDTAEAARWSVVPEEAGHNLLVSAQGGRLVFNGKGIARRVFLVDLQALPNLSVAMAVSSGSPQPVFNLGTTVNDAARADFLRSDDGPRMTWKAVPDPGAGPGLRRVTVDIIFSGGHHELSSLSFQGNYQELDLLANGAAGWVATGEATFSVNADGHLVAHGPPPGSSGNGGLQRFLTGTNRVNLTTYPALSVRATSASAMFNLFHQVGTNPGASFQRSYGASARESVIAVPQAGQQDLVLVISLTAGADYVFDRIRLTSNTTSAEMPAAVEQGGVTHVDVPLDVTEASRWSFVPEAADHQLRIRGVDGKLIFDGKGIAKRVFLVDLAQVPQLLANMSAVTGSPIPVFNFGASVNDSARAQFLRSDNGPRSTQATIADAGTGTGMRKVQVDIIFSGGHHELSKLDFTEAPPTPPTPVCGDGVINGSEACDPGADARCAPDCTGTIGFVSCVSDAECAAGQRCAPGNARNWQLGGWENVCAPTICSTQAVSANCGSLDALCGLCPCTPSCASKSCGDNLADGCGGSCPAVCATGTPCESDHQCANNATCMYGAARAFDASADPSASACMPAACMIPDPGMIDCGAPGSACGACLDCKPDCNLAVCGADDGCGGTCSSGSCADPSQTCLGGSCLAVLPLIHPDLSAPPLPDVDTTGSSLLSSTHIEVTGTGSARYSMPIPTPPGRAGMAPKLVLVYESTGGLGYIGRGWVLQGLSRVHRCARNVAQDAYSSGVDGSAYDAYCLDGQRLVDLGDGAFRTEPDSLARIVKNADGTWTVQTKDGMRRVYERLKPQAGIAAPKNNRVWPLRRVVDRAGNAWSIDYETGTTETDASGKGLRMSYRPTQITYTQHFATQSASGEPDEQGVNKITFRYDDIPCRPVADSGVAIYQCRRLRAVSATVGDDLHAGTLALEYSGELLHAITRYAGAEGSEVGDRLTFTYSPAPSGWDGYPLSTPFPSSLHNDPRNPVSSFRTAGDFDHDGATDLLFLREHTGGDTASFYSMPALDIFQNKTETNFELSEYLRRGASDVSVTDFDGDGDEELFVKYDPANELSLFEFSDGTFVPSDFDFSNVPTAQQASSLLGDVTGDGLPDLVKCGRFLDPAVVPAGTTSFSGEVVLANTGDFFEIFATQALPEDITLRDFCSQVRLVDLDGDGTQEVLHNEFATNDDTITHEAYAYRYSQVLRGLNPGVQKMHLGIVASGYVVTSLGFGDFNGDGLLDLVRRPPDSNVEVFLNLGAFAFSTKPDFQIPGASLRAAAPVDLNNDGYDELLWSGGGYWNITHFFPAFQTVSTFQHGCSDSDTIHPPLLGDFNGDAATDAIVTVSCEVTSRPEGLEYGGYTLMRGARDAPNLLVSLESAVSGPGDVVAYSASPGPSPHDPTKDPVFEFRPGLAQLRNAERAMHAPPGPVVSDHVASDYTVGDGLWTEFFYRGSYTDRLRREWVGFAEREVRVHAFANVNALVHSSSKYTYDLFYDGGRKQHPFSKLPKTIVRRRFWSPGPLSGNTAAGSPDIEQTKTGNTWIQHISALGGWFPSLFYQAIETETFHDDQSMGVGADITRFSNVDAMGNSLGEAITISRNGIQIRSAETTISYLPPDFTSWRLSDVRRMTSGGCGIVYDEQAATWVGSCGSTSFPVSFTYDERGLLRTITRQLPQEEEEEGEDDPDDLVVTYETRDSFGNPEDVSLYVAARTPLNVHYAYDASTHTYPWTASDDAGQTVYTNYDPRFGTLTQHQIVGAPAVQYAYDGFGRLGRIIHHDGSETLVTYAPAERDPPGSSSPSEYQVRPSIQVRTIYRAEDAENPELANLGDVTELLDKRGRSVRTIAAGRQGTSVLTERKFNSMGSLSSATRPHLPGDYSQGVSRTTYDEIGRVTSISHPGLETAYFEHTYLDLVADAYQSQLASLYGARTSSHPGLQSISLQQGGIGSGSLSVTDVGGAIAFSADGIGGSIDYEHDRHGNLAVAVDPYGRKRSWTYDEGSRLIALVSPDSSMELSTPLGPQSATLTYFADDLLRSRSVSEGGTWSYNYDAHRRITTAITPEGPTEYRWDHDDERDVSAQGRLMRIDGAGGKSLVYDYDSNLELRSVTQQMSDIGGVSALTLELLTEYGKLKSLTYPNLGAGEPGSAGTFSVEYEYDANGNVTSATGNGDKTYWRESSVYQGWGIDSEERLNGVVTRGYDAQTGAVTGVSYEDGSATAGVGYTYDEKGRVRTRRYSGDNGQEVFLYDEADRLQSVRLALDVGGDLLAYSYDYDLVGNLKTSPAGQHTLRSEDSPDGRGNGTARLVGTAGESIFHYDGQGRQRYRSGPAVTAGEQTIHYTSFDLPRQIVSGEEEIVTDFEYAPNGSRASMTQPGLAVRYFQDLFEERTEEAADESTMRERIYRVMIPGVGLVAEVTDHSENGGPDTRSHRVVLTDLTQSSLAAHLEGAPTTERYFFTPFGALQFASAQRGARFGGHNVDSGLGLVNMRGRIYDPMLGTFLTQDPILHAYDPQSFSSYAYVRNSPLNAIDPTGFECDASPNCPSPGPGGGGGGGGGEPIVECTDEEIKDGSCGGEGDPLMEPMLCNSPDAEFLFGAACSKPIVIKAEKGDSAPKREDWKVGPSSGPAESMVAPLDTPPGAVPAPLPEGAGTTALIFASLVPGPGELADMYVLSDPNAAPWARVAAAMSLGLNGFTAGAAPNFGPWARAGDEIAKGAARGAPKLLPAFARTTVDDVVASAARARGQTSEGARALAKKLGHAESQGITSAFSGIAPTQANAEAIIRSTLASPARTVVGARTIDVYNAAGQGVRYEAATNRFVGFLEDVLSSR